MDKKKVLGTIRKVMKDKETKILEYLDSPTIPNLQKYKKMADFIDFPRKIEEFESNIEESYRDYFLVDNFTKLLSQRTIQRYLNMCIVQGVLYRADFDFEDEDSERVLKERLKEKLFKVKDKNGEKFCEIYGLNYRIFLSWLRNIVDVQESERRLIIIHSLEFLEF